MSDHEVYTDGFDAFSEMINEFSQKTEKRM